jgi:hypothetical protein
MPGAEEELYSTADSPPVSGDLITLDGGGETVRVLAIQPQDDANWLVWAVPAQGDYS